MVNAIDLGEENLNIKNMFTAKNQIDQIILYINQNNIDLTICHNVYHHFPLWELFSRIKKETNSKLWLHLHDYKIVCPIHSLMRKDRVCEKCENKQFYKCTLYKCKSESYLKSFILTAESYYHNYFKDAYAFCDLIFSPSFF